MKRQDATHASSADAALPGAARWFTLRAVLVGFAGLTVICALTSYNDHTLANTPLIGNYLPVSVVLLTFLFVVLVNGPLMRYRPAWAMGSGELLVAFSILLVGCSVPGSGLVRYLVPSWVMPVALGRQYPEFQELFLEMGLPAWLFPTFGTDDRRAWATDPVVTGFEQRWNADGGYPYFAFLRPLLTWGVFVFAFFGGLLSMVLVVRRQWVENERLPFPLAQIQLALIAPPPRGRWLNDTLGRSSFWLALGAVVLLHVYNGLMQYLRQDEIVIPTGFNLQTLFTERPLSFVEGSLFRANLYLTAAAVTFFLNRAVGFSLWAFFIAQQLVRMWLGTATGDPTIRGQSDLHFGGLLAFAVMVVWSGRRHYGPVFAKALWPWGGSRKGSVPAGDDAVFAARAMLACMAVMAAWLALAGVVWWAAALLVVLLFMLFLTLTRFVAEVGLIHAQHQLAVNRPFLFADQVGLGKVVPVKTYYLSTLLQGVYFDARETLPVYASHALRLADETPSPSPRRQRLKLVGLFAAVLLFSYIVSVFFHLRNEYTHAVTLDGRNQYPIDLWGGRGCWEWMVVNPTLTYHRSATAPPHDPLTWFTGGFAAVLLLYIGRLTFPSWPLHPIGLLMVGSYPLNTLWLSFFVGWLAKVLVVRFGGTELYAAAKPVAIGIIVGESLAAALWMLTAMLLAEAHLPLRPVPILPP
ncbi:MAG: DUF6785 family protein [Tepidisphaerales bacterium]